MHRTDFIDEAESPYEYENKQILSSVVYRGEIGFKACGLLSGDNPNSMFENEALDVFASGRVVWTNK